jgi:hypothetical protein
MAYQYYKLKISEWRGGTVFPRFQHRPTTGEKVIEPSSNNSYNFIVCNTKQCTQIHRLKIANFLADTIITISQIRKTSLIKT